jgi:hypothetical protein
MTAPTTAFIDPMIISRDGTIIVLNIPKSGTIIASINTVTMSSIGEMHSNIDSTIGARGVITSIRTFDTVSMNGSKDAFSISTIGCNALNSFMKSLLSGLRMSLRVF